MRTTRERLGGALTTCLHALAPQMAHSSGDRRVARGQVGSRRPPWTRAEATFEFDSPEEHSTADIRSISVSIRR